MTSIEISSGLETVITACVHYRFHWMGDHWKQEIAGVGDCSSIPRVWSVEGAISYDATSTVASPPYHQIEIKKVSPQVTVARLEGRSHPHHYSASFTFEERPNEVVVEVEVEDRGGHEGEAPRVTYLIESSSGHREREGPATITWPHPDTKLIFEAEAPARVEANEAGLGTIRLKAIGTHDPSSEVQTLRYRWKWTTKPGHQIWDREV
jgi:hypothetical protein